MTLAQPFVIVCECKHVWAPFFTPLPMHLAGELMQKVVCPKCGAGASKHRARGSIPTAQEVIDANR